MTITYIILIICALLLIYSLWLLDRNRRVQVFRGSIVDMISEYSQKKISQFEFDDWEWAYKWYENNFVSYNRMVFSFKSLKFENWIPEGILHILLYCEDKKNEN